MRVFVHCQSGPYQTLSNQYSAQVPLSHNCDPRPRTRHLGGGRVLAQAIRQLDKPTEWHRTGCAITTRTQITTLRNFRLSHVTGCAFPLCRKSLGRTQHFKLARFILPQRVRRRLSPLCPPMIAMRTKYEFSVVAPRAVFLVVQIYAWVKLCKTSTHKKQPLISLFNQPVQFNRQRPHK
jgi:hypothetical protein